MIRRRPPDVLGLKRTVYGLSALVVLVCLALLIAALI
jgi:hypothetical protein